MGRSCSTKCGISGITAHFADTIYPSFWIAVIRYLDLSGLGIGEIRMEQYRH
jgi:hypothetical protein